MTPQRVQEIVGPDVVEDPSGQTDDCRYLAGRNELEGISFMIIDGQVARIEVDAAGFQTLSGAGVGSTEEELRRLFGARLQVELHTYLGERGHYLTLRSRGGGYGVRFETEGGAVFRFYVGPWEHLLYVEGCS